MSLSYKRCRQRKSQRRSNTTTYDIWEGAQVIAEYSNAPAGTGGTSYYLADRLSTRMTTDTTGAFKATQDHLPFGEDGGSTGTNEKHRFTSYERDSESGTDYAINRHDQYTNGRFMQPDSFGGDLGDPRTFNRYAYSLNDPIDLVDPLGLEPAFGGQNSGTCPAEFKTCVDVDVPGVGRVQVGLDGLGNGTFLWGNSMLSLAVLSRFGEVGPPKTFLLSPSLGQLLDTQEPPFLRGVRNDIHKSLREQLQACDQLGLDTAERDRQRSGLDIRFLQNRVKRAQLPLNLLQTATMSHTPPLVYLNLMSMFGVIPSEGDVVTWEDLLSGAEQRGLEQAAKAGKQASKVCRRAVMRKFGIRL